jgi:hypothetical protein
LNGKLLFFLGQLHSSAAGLQPADGAQIEDGLHDADARIKPAGIEKNDPSSQNEEAWHQARLSVEVT